MRSLFRLMGLSDREAYVAEATLLVGCGIGCAFILSAFACGSIAFLIFPPGKSH